MRGRSTRPTEQKKNLRRGDSREPPFSASTRKGWVQDRPFPSAKPRFPARPAGGRAVTGVGYRAAGQFCKKRKPLSGHQPERGGSRAERTSLRPGVLSSGFLPQKAGLPRRSRRGKPTSQVWTCTGSGHPHRRPPLTPPAAGRRPGHAPPVGSPAPPGRAPRPQWCWGARPG